MKYLFYILLSLLLLTACKKEEAKEDFRDKVLGSYSGVRVTYYPNINTNQYQTIHALVKKDSCNTNVVSFNFTEISSPDSTDITYKFELANDYTFETGSFFIANDSLQFHLPNFFEMTINYYMKKDF